MDKEWIIDVLGDLEAFAQENELPRLARQLREAIAVAELETPEGGQGARLRVVGGDGSKPRGIRRKAGAS